ncbi:MULTISPECIES: hypothetical protein [unclassified Spirosoma]|uniref:hypothetical protein n=1 Tax=unclassified Spirosoma TaxID=2621999 RepID=UPI00095AAE36|nr:MULTISPECIES: hypothetical protein [unclassified Spirosoma]MBN8825183.1 hypothetical protein [Spirosoma sp.]OJW77136.1 MAG: hypothetical protein BGO59_31210 [Spirosoma sp. 48-14]
MIRSLLSIALLISISSCSFTRQWQGNSNAQQTKASFKELTGRQTFTLHVPENDIYLAYQFIETDGEMSASVKSPSATVFNKRISTSEANTLHLVNQKGVEYIVMIKGKRASGAFDVRFVATPN